MRQNGFTLAELLIALVILGVVATFTIPKVLQSSQSNQFKSVGLESVATVVGALQAYKNENGLSPSTSFADITPYINYVRLSSLGSEQFDGRWDQGGTFSNCAQWGDARCLFLANGSVMMYRENTSFDSTDTTSAIWFYYDPDGKVTQAGSPVNGPGKRESFWIYYNGRVVAGNDCALGTTSSNWTPPCPMTSWQTDWFSWN